MKKIFLIILAIFIACLVIITACLPGIISIAYCRKPDEDTASESVDSVDSEPEIVITPELDSSENETSSTEEKKDLYADADGNIYEIIKEYTATDGRELVLFQNIKTMTVTLAIKAYFDDNYHLVQE